MQEHGFRSEDIYRKNLMQQVSHLYETATPKQRYLWSAAGLAGIAGGIVLSKFFNPQKRLQVRSAFQGKTAKVRETLGEARGTIPRKASRVRGPDQKMGVNSSPGDEMLNQKVRTAFGKSVKHARSVKTSVQDGIVTLKGVILRSEVNRLLGDIKRVIGVRDVINQLRVYESGRRIPSLQGEGKEYLR